MASTFILATGGYDTSVRFFDATKQTLIRTLHFSDQHVIRLAFSGEGPVAADEPLYIAVAGSPTICIYDVSTNDTSPNLFAPYTGHTEAVTAVGFEPKSNAFVYSASEDGTLQTWVPELSSTPQAAQGAVPGNQPDGNGLHPHATIPNGELGFYQHDGHPFTPSKFSNLGPNGLVAIHDATYYPPEAVFFTVDALGRLRIWDLELNTLRAEVIPHHSRRNIQCVELSSDYRTLVMANFDGYVFVYNTKELLADPQNVQPVTFRAAETYITRVRLSVSANLLVCTTRNSMTLVYRMADVLSSNSVQDGAENPEGRKILAARELPGHPGWVWDAAFVGDSEDYLFTCSSNMQVMLWALNDMRSSTECAGHRKAVVCLAVKERMSEGVPADPLQLDPEAAVDSILPPQPQFPFRHHQDDDDDDDLQSGTGQPPPAANGGGVAAETA